MSFAKWLVSEDNPLTARVVANRHWQAFFGTGIVKTVDDFGLQGEPPTHPELLDYLAVSLMRDGWSIKKLHRRIVSSSVYRQSSATDTAAAVIDPDNRWLTYMPRFRLDAEILRDSMLVGAGMLNRKLGGPPVRPPQPAGVTEVAYGAPKWDASSGADRYRRSLYTFSKRTAPFAMFSAFDAPSGEACLAQRTRSNSPLQALTLLNDLMVIELSRATGDRFGLSQETEVAADSDSPNAVEGPSVDAQLSRMFRAALTREPTPAELEMLRKFLEAQVTAFKSNPTAVAKFLAIDESTEVKSTDIQRAAWTATARVLFGLDEFQPRE
ncbi:MAG: DUF1553 domain-containing protein [Pirellulaceae bacterium]